MRKAIVTTAAGCLLAVPGTASADASLNIQIVAHVDEFCQIYPPAETSVDVRNGFAVIGQVKEICNTPSGYNVAASFSNLTSGKLNMGGTNYALIDGLATRSSDEPAVHSMAWSLSDAQVAQVAEPVVMRVTITPR